jgi:hypothetical protein
MGWLLIYLIGIVATFILFRIVSHFMDSDRWKRRDRVHAFLFSCFWPFTAPMILFLVICVLADNIVTFQENHWPNFITKWREYWDKDVII